MKQSFNFAGNGKTQRNRMTPSAVADVFDMLSSEDVDSIVRIRKAAIKTWEIKQRDGVVPPSKLFSVATSYNVSILAILRELEQMKLIPTGGAVAIQKRIRAG